MLTGSHDICHPTTLWQECCRTSTRKIFQTEVVDLHQTDAHDGSYVWMTCVRALRLIYMDRWTFCVITPTKAINKAGGKRNNIYRPIISQYSKLPKQGTLFYFSARHINRHLLRPQPHESWKLLSGTKSSTVWLQGDPQYWRRFVLLKEEYQVLIQSTCRLQLTKRCQVSIFNVQFLNCDANLH